MKKVFMMTGIFLVIILALSNENCGNLHSTSEWEIVDGGIVNYREVSENIHNNEVNDCDINTGTSKGKLYKNSEIQKAVKAAIYRDEELQSINKSHAFEDVFVTRAEVAAIVAKFFSLPYENKINDFYDVNVEDWYYVPVSLVNNAGLFMGRAYNEFYPNDYIQKDHFIVVIARLLKNEYGYDFPDNVKKYINYEDSHMIDKLFLPEIALATRENLVIKRSDNCFDPYGYVTREEFAMILIRLLSKQLY